MSGCYVCDTCNNQPPPPPPCTWGYDGATGQAYFGLDWTDVAPQYLWTNNQSIPSVFQYGSFYWSYPGNYEVYYEGQVLDNCCMVPYNWDVFYEIWVHPGTAGGCGTNGLPGADSYLMVICGPYGPYANRTNKMAPMEKAFTVISDTGDEIVTEQRVGDVSVRATYHKLDHSRQAELDPTGVKVGLSQGEK
jgi:hypothetical protein